ncbi:hypothetical protein FVV09_20880 [Salmonella enterica]|nr:hypothetical protein [Salmonella enterica]MKX84506.1 hypothetical protein [Salmonella enterica]
MCKRSLKRDYLTLIFEHTPMILGANAHIYALPGLHKKFHNLRRSGSHSYIYTPVILISLCMNFISYIEI